MKETDVTYFYDKCGDPILSFEVTVDNENNLTYLKYAGELLYTLGKATAPCSIGKLKTALDNTSLIYPALSNLNY